MSPEKIFSLYYRCKHITRVRGVRGPLRLLAGGVASVCGKCLERSLERRRRSGDYPRALDGKGGFVVSLTSFPPRMERLWMVVDCLMRGSRRPAEIVLTLFEGDFPEGSSSLPENLQPYLERGLRVVFAKENLRPHLKYYYTFLSELEGGRRSVVTVDDDVFYSPDTLERLWKMHSKNPRAVCANCARKIWEGPYRSWEHVNEPAGPSQDLLALGYGGVLYPPAFYSSCPQLFDTQELLSLAPKADDLWLKYCENLCSTGVCTGEYYALPPDIPSSQKQALSGENVDNGGNDKVWEALKNHKK